MKNVEVRGANFINKGAELMLESVIHHFQDNAEISLVMEPNLKFSPFIDRARLGLLQKFELRKGSINLEYLFNILPKSFFERYGIVLPKDVDIILDASGLAYSDKWGIHNPQRLLELGIQQKKNKNKLVLMPQAFGPFENKKIALLMKEALNYCNLVYARDSISYQHLIDVNPNVHIEICPDITIGLDLFNQDILENRSDENINVAFIPNKRMIDKTNLGEDQYLNFCVNCINILRNRGFKPCILVHELNDYELAKKISSGVQNDLSIISPQSALEIKRFIGKMDIVVGSRFHGLVSSLSQGVYCIGTGWSHKYEMLFKDFGVSDCVIPTILDVQELDAKLSKLLDPQFIEEAKQTIKFNSELLKAEVRKMWSSVDQLLNHV